MGCVALIQLHTAGWLQYYYWDYTVGVALAAIAFFVGAGAGNFAAPASSSSPNASSYNAYGLDDGGSFGPYTAPAWEQDGNGTPAAQNRTSLYAVDP